MGVGAAIDTKSYHRVHFVHHIKGYLKNFQMLYKTFDKVDTIHININNKYYIFFIIKNRFMLIKVHT